MNVTAVDNGTFTSSEKIDLRVDADSYFGGGFDASYCYVQDMYVYNDMLLVVGSISAEKWVYFDENGKIINDVEMDTNYYQDCLSKEAVFVSVHTASRHILSGRQLRRCKNFSGRIYVSYFRLFYSKYQCC